MESKDLVRDVLQAAADFNGRRLWGRFSNFDCFAVRVPDQGESMLGVVLGDAGEQFGLSLFRGETAAAFLSAILDPDGPGDDMAESVDMLGFSMDTFGELLPEAQASIRKAGLHPRYNEQVPNFLAKRPGRQPRVPDQSDLRLLLMVLRGAIEADRKNLLAPATLEDREGLCTLVLSGDPAAPQVSVTRERWPDRASAAAEPVQVEAADLSGLPRLDATWLVGLPVMPAGIEGDERSLQMLLVADDASGFVLQGRPVFVGEFGEAADALLETFRGGGIAGRKGLPRKVVFSIRHLYDAMAPALRRAGVTCIYMPSIPKLQEIAADFFGLLDDGIASFPDALDAPPAQEVPAPDDLAGWKAADHRVGTLFADCLKYEERLSSTRAVKRYFGRDDLPGFFKAQRSRGVAGAYASWAMLDYRSTRKSRTRAEELLAEGLPQPEAMLLRAQMEAYPTLYRVADHDPEAGTVHLEDVLLGGAVTVHDQLMSENIENGLFVTARAFAAGRYHFLDMAGPPLGAGMGLEAAEFLRRCGMEFTPDGLRHDAHAFGWLWDWADEWEANRQPPHLCNTDGDDLLWHTASFAVASQPAVREALRRRKDIEHDEDSDEFIWVKRAGRGAKMLGGPVTLGRIEFVGDELVLTVNSAERFAKGCAWLARLPGVVFRDVTTRRLDEPDEDRPMDERIAKPEPVEMPPELVVDIQEMLAERYMEWLDTRLPNLGGKTPRQACKSPSGREQVALMIRTMPDPMGPAPVRVPRQAMLRELGLAAEATPEPPAGPAILRLSGPAEAAEDDSWVDGGLPVNRSPKVGRNDPCPCGSGKKYKKCCGRRMP